MVQAVARLLLAPVLVLAAAFLVKGATDVGDGFSAGIVASMGVLLQFVAFGHRRSERVLPLRWVHAFALGGLLVAFVVAFAPLLGGEPFLSHLPPPGEKVVKLGTLELMTSVLFDLGVCLLVVGVVLVGLPLVARAEDRDLP